MQVELVSINIESKGKYSVANVAYRNNGKLSEKKVMSFGPQEPAYKFLLNASPGQVLEVKTVKNDKGFWDWVEAGPAGEASAAAAPSGKAVGASPAPRNTYETPEERAVKQKYIVRQSSISSAIEYAKLNGKKSPSVEELLVVARQFEDYVFGTTTPTQQSVFTAIAEMSDDIPF